MNAITVKELRKLVKSHKDKNCKPYSSMNKKELYAYAVEIGKVRDQPKYKKMDLLKPLLKRQ